VGCAGRKKKKEVPLATSNPSSGKFWKLFAEAAAAYRRAVDSEPGNADALNNLAWAYHELGANLDEAGNLCRRAAELRPSHRAYYLDTLGSVLLKQGRAADAIAAFESALAGAADRDASLRAAIQQHLASARALAEK
jgi:tetratricopeptide (TPR) repeat protein